MGKTKNKGSAPSTPQRPRPFVSVCTPTFNRRPFIPIMLDCFRNQTYPKDRIEWIIVDDGTDKVGDLLQSAGIPQIRYSPVKEKMTLGKKRNYMHSLARGDILVYMDDDDYYPPERIEHAVDTLVTNTQALCAGSSILYLFFKHVGKMVQFGPYGPNHATAGTFAFKKELLRITKYDDNACLAEERLFLKEYTVPFVQLDPMKTILVFSHEHNTFDKRKLLVQNNPNVHDTTVTVADFIKLDREAHIKRFFMEDIDRVLATYDPGTAKYKPDVVRQTMEIEKEREKEHEKMMQNAMNQITPISVKNAEGVQTNLTMQQVAKLLQDMEQNVRSLQLAMEQQRQYIEFQAEAIEELQEKQRITYVEPCVVELGAVSLPMPVSDINFC